MNTGEKIALGTLGFIVGWLLGGDFINGHKIHALDDRITALEQSQCSLKQDKVHADYKLNVCIAQLRSKP